MRKKNVIRGLTVFAALSLLMMPAYAGQAAADRSAPVAYMEQYPVDGMTAQAASLPLAGENAGTVLEGKSILFVGDSLTTGYGLSDVRQSWPSLLQSSYGMEVTVCSISSSSFTEKGWSRSGNSSSKGSWMIVSPLVCVGLFSLVSFF